MVTYPFTFYSKTHLKVLAPSSDQGLQEVLAEALPAGARTGLCTQKAPAWTAGMACYLGKGEGKERGDGGGERSVRWDLEQRRPGPSISNPPLTMSHRRSLRCRKLALG